MDFFIEEKALDIATLKFEDTVTNYGNIFYFTALDANSNNYILEASMDDLKTKALNAMSNVITALAEFFRKIRLQIEIKVQQMKLNKKLEELKDIMAKKRSKAVNRKIDYISIKKYKEFYSDFIDKYTAELIKGLNKDFKTVEEYEKWRVDMLNKLAEFNYKLSDEEQWKLSITINSAVELTAKEAENREKNLKMVEEKGSNAIKGLEKYYRKINIENSYVNYNRQYLKIFALQNSFIGSVCSKLSQAIQKVVRFICKHTLLMIGLLMAALLAL